MIIPRYWMDETSGALRPAVEAYLNGQTMNREQVVAMRAYLRQWIGTPGWLGPAVESLRLSVDDLTSREAIHAWLAKAEEQGIDPL